MHLLEIWTLWHPVYWLSGSIKAITAVISLGTAVALLGLVPKALALPSAAQLELANQELKKQISDRQHAELELVRSRDLKEAIFDESTDAIFLVDSQKGIGLGLALVQKQIVCLGGTIAAQSDAGEVRFVIELLLMPVSDSSWQLIGNESALS